MDFKIDTLFDGDISDQTPLFEGRNDDAILMKLPTGYTIARVGGGNAALYVPMYFGKEPPTLFVDALDACIRFNKYCYAIGQPVLAVDDDFRQIMAFKDAITDNPTPIDPVAMKESIQARLTAMCGRPPRTGTVAALMFFQLVQKVIWSVSKRANPGLGDLIEHAAIARETDKLHRQGVIKWDENISEGLSISDVLYDLQDLIISSEETHAWEEVTEYINPIRRNWVPTLGALEKRMDISWSHLGLHGDSQCNCKTCRSERAVNAIASMLEALRSEVKKLSYVSGVIESLADIDDIDKEGME